ncbi:hypothetical protein [Actinomadura napierensis]|uniref:DUF2637 domain-containing protein n=1 Tax=Actinomadura napierensis TaxID=267854 RepID=A0ABN2ZPS7_9ACTN
MPSDPMRPGGPRYSPAQRRLLTATAGLVVAALAAGAYVLTYPVLRELALAGRASHRWAPVYPVMADALTAMTILALVVARNARWWTRLLRWALLLLLVAGAAAAAVQHSVWGFGSLPRTPVRAGVAVAPHVLLVIAVWLWLTMIKQIRVARPAGGEPEPVETQRGHVRVLPALEPPAALDAPAGDDGSRYADEREPVRPLDLLPVSGPEHDFEPETVHDREPAHEYETARENEYAAVREYGAVDEHGYEEAAVPVAAREGGYDDEDEGARHDAEPEDEGARGAEYDAGPEGEGARGDGYDDDEDYGVEYAEEFGREPSPPLDPLPEPRPAPALLATDMELVRSRDTGGPEPLDHARTTRPDIVMPGHEDEPDPSDAEEYDGPPADRAEDPDAGGDGDAPPIPRVPRPSPSPEDETEPGEGRIWDWNPPPSGNFRSGPTPPVE